MVLSAPAGLSLDSALVQRLETMHALDALDLNQNEERAFTTRNLLA